MRKSLVVIIPLLVMACCTMLGGFSLNELLPQTTKVVAGNKANINLSGDLGFVLEEFNQSNGISYLSNGEVVGECVWLENVGNNLNKVCSALGLNITKRYSTATHYMIEGISAKVKYALFDSGNNVQIAVTEASIVVGSPIIYGSY